MSNTLTKENDKNKSDDNHIFKFTGSEVHEINSKSSTHQCMILYKTLQINQKKNRLQ